MNLRNTTSTVLKETPPPNRKTQVAKQKHHRLDTILIFMEESQERSPSTISLALVSRHEYALLTTYYLSQYYFMLIYYQSLLLSTYISFFVQLVSANLQCLDSVNISKNAWDLEDARSEVAVACMGLGGRANSNHGSQAKRKSSS